MSPGTDNSRIRRKFNCALMVFCCFVLGFLNIPASAKSKAKVLPKTAKLLPPETMLLMDIDDFQQLKTQFEKTSFYKFYADPAMAAFVEDAKVKWHEKIQKLDDNDIFKALLSTDIWPEGRVAAALVLNEQSKDFNEPPIVIITQWGEGIDKIKESVDKMLKKNIEAGGHQKKSEKYRGVRIEITIDEASATLNHCFIGDSFIAATDIDILKFVIAHIKGSGSPTLADDGDYKAAMKTVGPYYDIDFYINIKQVIKTMLAEDPAGEARKWTADLGIDNVAALACSAGVGRNPGNSATTKVFLKINGAKKGICKMLEAESAGYNLPRFIPASAYSVTFFNLNIKKAYDELYNIVYNFNPQYGMMMQMLDLPDSPDGEPGLKLKTDVINHLGSQIVIARSVNKPFSNTTLPTEPLVALAIDDREAIEKSLSLLHSKVLAANNPDARRELLGHTIYLLGQSAMPFLTPGRTPMQTGSGPGAPQTPTLAFTVSDTHLIFASEAAVERAIRALSSTETLSVGQAKWFASAKQAIPSAVGIATLEDNAASGELFWWMIKQNKADQTSAKFCPAGVSELVNFDLLPSLDAVRKYLGQSAFYGISTPEGFFFEFKDISPTE
ncbi:MAG: hypothetical protein PHQ35_03300 [Phycisphaerae bacterium]|nr:hypothetical protein [Phycisphaerae bacterium]MDD5380680.1 hypothetical protein [Phycisphaerae bacterium]